MRACVCANSQNALLFAHSCNFQITIVLVGAWLVWPCLLWLGAWLLAERRSANNARIRADADDARDLNHDSSDYVASTGTKALKSNGDSDQGVLLTGLASSSQL